MKKIIFKTVNQKDFKPTILVFLFIMIGCRPTQSGSFPQILPGFMDLNFSDLFTGDPAVDIARIMDPKNIQNIKKKEERNRLFLQGIYCLAYAENKKPFRRDAEDAIEQAGIKNKTSRTPYFEIMKVQLMQQLEEAEDLAVLDAKSMEKLKQGVAPKIPQGPNKGNDIQVLEIISSEKYQEVEKEIINLRISDSNKKGSAKETIKFAVKKNEAGFLSDESLAQIKKENN